MKVNVLLSILLAVQAIALLDQGTDSAQSSLTLAYHVSGGEALNAVTGFSLKRRAGDAGQPATDIELARGADGWTLPKLKGYPADDAKMSALLEKLSKLKLDVITTSQRGAHARLHVSEQTYDRLISLTTAQETRDVYLGYGARGVTHLRFRGRDEVYQVRGISLWDDLKPYLSTFVKSSYLDVGEVSAVKVIGPKSRRLELSRTEVEGVKRWSVQGVKPDELDQGRARRFVNAAKSLARYDVARGEEATFALKEGVTVELTTPQGVTRYQLGATATRAPRESPTKRGDEVKGPAQVEVVYASVIGSPHVAEVESFRVRPLMTQTREEFWTEARREAEREAQAQAEAARKAESERRAQPQSPNLAPLQVTPQATPLSPPPAPSLPTQPERQPSQ